MPNDTRTFYHFERPRLNNLFTEAARFPLVMVCAGSGYGKTSAVLDFLQSRNECTAWVQFSKLDNVLARFWETITRTIAQVNTPYAKALGKLGFPDTVHKQNQYLNLLANLGGGKRQIVVLDDFHNIENDQVIQFIEKTIHKMPAGASIFILSRSIPPFNTTSLIAKNYLYYIKEDDLLFTDNELSQYFIQKENPPDSGALREIMQDTEGWAFAINLIARSYQKAPGYGGYLRKAIKTNIFDLMKNEVWDGLSEPIQKFMAQISLIDHLSFDLISLLACGNKELIKEMEKQNAYVRRDSYINAYVIHPLFLEFLATKQDLLSEEIKRKTYTIAGIWCNDNGFVIDAISYFEKIGDYSAIVSILKAMPAQIPYDIAKYAKDILDCAPKEIFIKVESLAIMHLRCCMSQGKWQEALDLAEYYESKFLSLQEDGPFKKDSLCCLYFYWAYLRSFTCIMHERYDFDIYFEKFCRCLSPSFDHSQLNDCCSGPWIIITGSSRKNAPQDFIDAVSRSANIISKHFNGLRTGEDDLARGELAFYRADIKTTETIIPGVLELASKTGHFELAHRALLYAMRISAARGNYEKMEQVLKNTKAHLDESGYHNRYINYDISVSWFYCLLGLPEKVTDWLKQDFSEYSHAGFTENLSNQVKARYCYITRNYPLLLSYIMSMKGRESFLFGRIEMLAMEACVYSRMKQKKDSLAVLEAAYKNASPNEILMPFIEMGKDMRTLCLYALNEKKCGIPKPWLKQVLQKSATYAKRRSHVICEYLKTSAKNESVYLSPQESGILLDLSHGLSRTQIAAGRNLSLNTVKTTINHLYSKLGAENLADLIRIAAERKII